MKSVRVGIVGCGGIAKGKHLPAVAKIEEAQMVAFCDIVPERAEWAAKEYGGADAKVYTDYKEMLAKEKLDVVHVLTPNSSHAPITIAAMEAGCHVMCEKPMAKTAADAKAMLDASKRTGKLLTIGYQGRYRADSTYLKKSCVRGDLGDIYIGKAHAVRRRGVPTWGVFLDAEAQGGGPLIDIGTHALDLTLWMMDNYQPQSVTGTVYRKLADQKETGNAWGDWDPTIYTVEDSAFGFITMKNGATIFLESSWALNTLETGEAICTLCGTKAGADFRDGLRLNTTEFGKLVTIKPSMTGGGVAFYDAKTEHEKDIECRTWYDAVLYGKELVVKPEQALVVTEILEAIYKSAATGKPVVFE